MLAEFLTAPVKYAGYFTTASGDGTQNSVSAQYVNTYTALTSYDSGIVVSLSEQITHVGVKLFEFTADSTGMQVYANGKQVGSASGNAVVARSTSRLVLLGERVGSAAYAFRGQQLLHLMYRRRISPVERALLVANPWQIFRPRDASWFVAVQDALNSILLGLAGLSVQHLSTGYSGRVALSQSGFLSAPGGVQEQGVAALGAGEAGTAGNPVQGRQSALLGAAGVSQQGADVRAVGRLAAALAGLSASSEDTVRSAVHDLWSTEVQADSHALSIVQGMLENAVHLGVCTVQVLGRALKYSTANGTVLVVPAALLKEYPVRYRSGGLGVLQDGSVVVVVN